MKEHVPLGPRPLSINNPFAALQADPFGSRTHVGTLQPEDMQTATCPLEDSEVSKFPMHVEGPDVQDNHIERDLSIVEEVVKME